MINRRRPKQHTDKQGDRREYGAGRKKSTQRRSEESEKTRSPRTAQRSEDKRFERKESKKTGSSRYTERTDRRSSNNKYTDRQRGETFGTKKATVSFKKKESSPNKGGDRDGIRLNKYIANSGICSRRQADDLITEGHIMVNDAIITTLGAKVLEGDVVKYKGSVIKNQKPIYILFNKPKNCITTAHDERGRKTIFDLIDHNLLNGNRVFSVGRLDRDTTGLLLLTNDGELADKLSHPKSNIHKIYHVILDKNLQQGDLNKIMFGLELEDGFIRPDDMNYVAGASKNEVGITIHSGKNRIVRRIFEKMGYEVVKLDRVFYANLSKKDLPRGRSRVLNDIEIRTLYKLCGMSLKK